MATSGRPSSTEVSSGWESQSLGRRRTWCQVVGLPGEEGRVPEVHAECTLQSPGVRPLKARYRAARPNGVMMSPHTLCGRLQDVAYQTWWGWGWGGIGIGVGVGDRVRPGLMAS